MSSAQKSQHKKKTNIPISTLRKIIEIINPALQHVTGEFSVNQGIPALRNTRKKCKKCNSPAAINPDKNGHIYLPYCKNHIDNPNLIISDELLYVSKTEKNLFEQTYASLLRTDDIQ